MLPELVWGFLEMNFRPRNAAWRGWRSIFGGVIAGIKLVFSFRSQKKKRSVTTCSWEVWVLGSRTDRDRRPKGGRIFVSCFCWLGWIFKHSLWMGNQMYILQGFLLVDSFLGLTKHHFWRLCWWFVLYEALYFSKDNQLLKPKIYVSWWFGELDPENAGVWLPCRA